MYRVLLEIPIPGLGRAIPIYSYGTLLGLGILLALLFASRRARAVGISPAIIYDIGLYAVLAGIVGARLAFLLEDREEAHSLLDLVAVWRGGLTFQGGLFLSIAAVLLYLGVHRLPAGKILDIFAPSLALGIAFGRIGCFLNGCCWGRICSADFPLAVRFPVDSLVHAYHLSHWDTLQAEIQRFQLSPALLATGSFPVHPAQLYSSLAMVVIFCLLLLADRLPSFFDGSRLILFLVLYSIARFFLEYWRDDTPRYFRSETFSGLSLGQILAAVTLGVTLLVGGALWRSTLRNKG